MKEDKKFIFAIVVAVALLFFLGFVVKKGPAPKDNLRAEITNAEGESEIDVDPAENNNGEGEGVCPCGYVLDNSTFYPECKKKEGFEEEIGVTCVDPSDLGQDFGERIRGWLPEEPTCGGGKIRFAPRSQGYDVFGNPFPTCWSIFLKWEW